MEDFSHTVSCNDFGKCLNEFLIVDIKGLGKVIIKVHIHLSKHYGDQETAVR